MEKRPEERKEVITGAAEVLNGTLNGHILHHNGTVTYTIEEMG